jgi:surface carbohydrate biosynthesis protein
MKSIDFLYFIEHTARELDIACAVKFLLKTKYNLTTEIRSIVLNLEETLSEFLPKVVILPYCVSIKSLNLDKIVHQWSESKYINLSYEQLLGEAQKGFKAPADDFSQHYVVHHAWGDFFKSFLINSGVPDRNIVVNGNPSYALYHEPYKHYYGEVRTELGKRFGLDPNKRWALVPENYGWAFFENHMLRDRIRRGFDPDHAYKYRDFSVDSLRMATEWWYRGAAIDDVELIIRPRPAIPKAMFIDKITRLVGSPPDDLHIIKYGSVREWILASDFVFSSYSTTLLEAATAKKPLFMLLPYPIPGFIHVAWNDLAKKIRSETDFISILNKTDHGRNWIKLDTWVREKMLHHGDPISNQADILASIERGDISVPFPGEVIEMFRQAPISNVFQKMKKIGWRLFENGIYMIGLKTRSQRWKPHQTDAIDQGDIADRITRWEKVLG